MFESPPNPNGNNPMLGITLPPLLQDMAPDIGISDQIQWDSFDDCRNSLIDGASTEPQLNHPSTTMNIPDLLETLRELRHSSPVPTPSANVKFLQQDNARLRESNSQLQDEVAVLRSQESSLRSELRRLDRSFEELLYLSSVQDGEEKVAERLFSISGRVMAMKKILSSCSDSR